MSASQPGTNPARGTNSGLAGSSGGRSERSGRGRGPGRAGEQFMVPGAEFRSYYGRPVIKEPVWKEPDVPAYLFFGGLAGASSVLGAAAQLTGHPGLARAAKVAALGGISVSTVALINDLGRPARFHHMLRVFKLSSPMSVGSWILSAYGPAAGAAALSDLTGILPAAGVAATAGAALLGPAVTTYTAVLLCDTAVPAWHEAHREMPYVFAGSAASAAGGFGLRHGPAARDPEEPRGPGGPVIGPQANTLAEGQAQGGCVADLRAGGHRTRDRSRRLRPPGRGDHRERARGRGGVGLAVRRAPR